MKKSAVTQRKAVKASRYMEFGPDLSSSRGAAAFKERS